MPKTITSYSWGELSPEARAKAMKKLPKPDCEWTLDECVKSLEALCEVADVRLKDWSLGPYSYPYIKVEIDGSTSGDGPEALTGPRALAWIENNIFGKLRQSWALKARGRKYTRPGHVPACPLTGVSFDEDILDIFRKRDMGITIKERFESLAGVIARICEAELDYQSKDGLEERADCYFDGAMFDEEGTLLKWE